MEEEALRRFNWSQSVALGPFHFVRNESSEIDRHELIVDESQISAYTVAISKGREARGRTRGSAEELVARVGRFHSWIPHRFRGTIGGKTRTSDVIASRCLASDWLADSITCQCIATDSRMREPLLRPDCSLLPSLFLYFRPPTLAPSRSLPPFLSSPRFPSATLRSTPTPPLPCSPLLLLLPSSGYHMTNVSWLLFRDALSARSLHYSCLTPFFPPLLVLLRFILCFFDVQFAFSLSWSRFPSLVCVRTSNETFITRSRAISLPIQSMRFIFFNSRFSTFTIRGTVD